MTAYYNDNDAYVCAWLRNLIAAGHITAGDVDERPIEEVTADDVRGYDRCHFFAGIAGWELALQLAGWTGSCWTGSCPCQPFSQAGKRRGAADERHLWPEFHRLIAECQPSTVFGEQVAGPAGRAWLSGVRDDLEGAGYAVGAADLPAACAGAPHKRQRLFFVADADFDGSGTRSENAESEAWWRSQRSSERLGEPDGAGRHAGIGTAEATRHRGAAVATGGELADSKGAAARAGHRLRSRKPDSRQSGVMGDTISQGSQERGGTGARRPDGADPWQAAVETSCADGRTRRVGAGVQPLAHGVPSRVGQLRAYGNAIVPQVAAQFVSAYMECRP